MRAILTQLFAVAWIAIAIQIEFAFSFQLKMQLNLGLRFGLLFRVLNKRRQFARTSCDLHFNFANFANLARKISPVATWETMSFGICQLRQLQQLQLRAHFTVVVCLWQHVLYLRDAHATWPINCFRLVANRLGQHKKTPQYNLQLTLFSATFH